MSTFPPLSQITGELVVETAQHAGEPGWLIQRRAAAWQQFVAAPPPIWRRTDLTKFQAEAMIVPTEANATILHWDATLAAQGVIFTPLIEAAKSDNPVVRDLFGTAVDLTAHKFNMLHDALWQDGVFLYVPKGIVVEMPFRATISLGATGSVFPHNLIVLEDGASASFIEEYVSDDVSAQGFANPATEIIVRDGAALRFVTLQTWGRGVYHIGTQRVVAGRDAHVEWVSASLGAKLQHIEAEVALTEVGSRIEWQGVTFANEQQVLLTAPVLRHVGTNTESHLDFKTVVDDDGYSTFDGMIKIEKDSKGTATRLEEHALHLGGKGRSDSIPGLKIDTNDVARAGHASTSGEIDDEQLFYMLSRGIGREEAMHMIITGFFEPVLERIPSDDVRERVSAVITAKM